MNPTTFRLTLAGLLLGALAAGPVLASGASASHPGSLTVKDDAKMFSPAGVEKAKEVMTGIHDSVPRNLFVETFPAIPESRKADYEKAKGDRETLDKFYRSW